MDGPLHPDDIVVRKDNEAILAVVERTHDGIDTHQPYPGRTEVEPIKPDRSISQADFRRFMKSGVPPKDTVLVRWQNELSMELLPISKVKLLDRSLLIGDIVKRNVHDAMSGVIINTFTKCTLQPMCDVTHSGHKLKGLLPPGKWTPEDGSPFIVHPDHRPEPIVDVPAAELRYSDSPTEDDMVIYKDWIGRVEGITNNICVKLSDNGVVEIADELGHHADGTVGAFSVGDIVKTTKGTLRTGSWVYGRYNPNTPPVGTVVSVRTVTADVTWLQKRYGSLDDREPPQQLETPELESSDFQVYDRTRRPGRASQALEGRASTLSDSETDVRLNLRVRFNDLAGARLKYSTPTNLDRIPRLERHDHLGYDLNVFDVSSFHTDVTVQWQDLSITVEDSVNLVPDADIDDEHAVWPGEIAHTLGLSPVPHMPHVEQPEKVGVVQAVNAADRLATVQWQPNSTIHYAKDPVEESGLPPPIVAQAMSYLPGPKEEISLYDIEAPAALNVRRGDIVLILSPSLNPFPSRPQDVTWLGEMLTLHSMVRLLYVSEQRRWCRTSSSIGKWQ
jgi:ubiquitin-conjugating enzyme E2 O